MAQFLRPDSNVTQSNFTGGFAEIDEASASDADFAWGANNTAAVLEVGTGNPTGTPQSGTCTVRYRIAKTNAGTVDGGGNAVTVTGEVYEGTTQIATDSARTADGTWTEYSFTFAASAVTDWTDVRLRFTTSASGGSPANRRGGAVSWAELETPDAAAGTTASPGTGQATLTGFAPAIIIGTVIATATGQLVATGFAPTATIAPAYQSIATAASNGGATSLVIPVPAGTTDGDQLYTFITSFSNRTITPPAGGAWGSPIASVSDGTVFQQLHCYTRTAASEPADYTWGLDLQRDFVGLCVRITGPPVVNVSATTIDAGATDTTHKFDGLTPTTVGTLLMVCHTTSTGTASTFTPPTGMTERADVASAASPDASPIAMELSTQILTATGATGARDATGTQNGRCVSIGLALATADPVTASPAVGQLVASGFAPTVTATDHQTVSTATGQLIATGFAPTVQGGAGTTVTPGTGLLVATGFAPTVTASDHQTVTPGTGQLVATGFAPSIFAGTTVNTLTGQANLTGFAPTVSVTQNVTAATATGQATLAGFAPTVSASDHQTVTPGVGVLSATGFAPVLDSGIQTDTGALALTGFAPTVSSTQHVTVETEPGALVATGFAPTVIRTGGTQADPGTGLLTLTGYAPAVLIRAPYRFRDPTPAPSLGTGPYYRFRG